MFFLKESIKNIIKEVWFGTRATGSPSPPYRKGKGKHSTQAGRPSQHWQGDVLAMKKYESLRPEQKLSVLKYGNKKYDIFKTGGFKHYVKKEDLGKDFKGSKTVRKLNAEIGRAEGLAANRANKFWKAYSLYQKGKASHIDIERSSGQKDSLNPKQAEQWARNNIVYQRYKAQLFKDVLNQYRRNK